MIQTFMFGMQTFVVRMISLQAKRMMPCIFLEPVRHDSPNNSGIH